MSLYRYEARTPTGKRVRGTLAADSWDSCLAELDRLGLRAFEVKPREPSFVESRFGYGLSRAGLIQLTRHLSGFDAAGVPLARGLGSIAREGKGEVARMAGQLASTIVTGNSLTQAMALHPRAFRPFYLGAVQAGERAGTLKPVLDMLLAHLQREEELADETRSAARYPAFVLFYCSLAFIGIFAFAIPGLEKFYATLGTQPPHFTQLLLTSRNVMVEGWDVIAWTAVIVALILAWAWTTQQGAILLGRFLLHAPFFWRYSGRPEVARFVKIFALVLRTKVPVPEALELAGRSIKNPALKRDALWVRDGVVAGKRLSDALRSVDSLPPRVSEVASAAEAGESLGDGLEQLALELEFEVRRDLRRFGTTVGPVLLGIAGLILIGLILAVDLPLIEQSRMGGFASTPGFTAPISGVTGR